MKKSISRRFRKPKVGMLGSGAWGTAISKVLVENGFKVTMWCFESEVAEEINHEHTNSRYLIGVDLPEQIKATVDLMEAASKKDYLFIAIPSPFVVETAKKIIYADDIMEGKTHIGVLSKGFVETSSGIKPIVEAVEDYLPGIYKEKVVYISGPSHAEEVARGKLTGLISACKNGTNAIRFRRLLSGEQLVVFSSLDPLGVQISAAMKNVIAIAYGMLDALREFSDNFGDNTESLVLAAGLNEIQRLGIAMGATHPETFTSIAGVGDLDVTCRSRFGRNRRLGREIIIDHILNRYPNIEDLISHMSDLDYFAEGIVAAQYAYRLANQLNLSLPISQGVYRILNREAEPYEELMRILRRMG
jgi:glycerol-3-phosphate dehydrogenase (NAD(P)+)